MKSHVYVRYYSHRKCWKQSRFKRALNLIKSEGPRFTSAFASRSKFCLRLCSLVFLRNLSFHFNNFYPLSLPPDPRLAMARTSKKAKSAEDSVGPEGPVDILEEDVSHPGIVDASPQYKEDINAFSIPVEEDKEFISGMPSEILDEILSYLILDHDPELAAKVHSPDPKLRENPHVLLSLAAMSRHFRDHVEDFSRRHLTTHKQMYSFKTTAELEAVKIVRRSDRLKEKPTRDHRCYRFELVSRLRWRCIQCNAFSGRRATMANGVGCCQHCEWLAFPNTIVSICEQSRIVPGFVSQRLHQTESFECERTVRLTRLDAYSVTKSSPPS